MALVASQIAFTDANGVEGDHRIRTAVLTFGASYTALGEPVTPALFGLQVIEHLQVDNVSRTGTRLISWDSTGGTIAAPGKLRVWTAIGTEATGATDQSAISVNIKAIGR